jgi:AcrR family transcriptional regulator
MTTIENNADHDSATRQRNRNRILDAATELLSSGQPLTKLSVNRIAQSAGISRATFYLHFASKRDLMTALTKREIEPWLDSAMPALQAGTITRDEIEQLSQALVAVYRAHRGVFDGIIELAEYDEETKQAWQETTYGIAAAFQAAIQHRRPERSESEAIQLSRMIVWAGERFLHQELADSSEDEDHAIVWTLAEMAWKLMND